MMNCWKVFSAGRFWPFFPVNHFGRGGFLAIFHKKKKPPDTSPKRQQKIASIILGASLKPLAPESLCFDRPAIESVGETLNSQQVVAVSHGDGKLHE